MLKVKGLQSGLREKIKVLLWEQNPADLSLLQRVLLRQLQTAALVLSLIHI